jgi:TRAP-type transport system small permease protein
MRHLLPRLEHLVEWLMALALSVMVVLIFGNVVLR